MKLCLVAGVMVAACAYPKPPPPAPARHTELGLTIKTATLRNGLRIVVVEDPHANEVQVTMRYGIGAGDDLENPGIAHLVEHLMFQQTLGAQTLFAQLEDNATFFNAFTTLDATTYVSRARPDLLDKLLSIEAVRLGFRCTSITDSAFEREREVVKQETRLRSDARDFVIALHAAVYPDGHPYRHAETETLDSVGRITRQEACAFADSFYATNNAALVISGNVSMAQIEASLGKFLARIAKRTAASPGRVAPAHKLPPHEAQAPVDEESLLVTWPLPNDPYGAIGARMMARATTNAIDNMIKGRIEYVELGDERATAIGYLIEPAKGESIEDVRRAVKDTVTILPRALESPIARKVAFDGLRQRAIHAQYAALEDGSVRDERLAAHVLAGRDPARALADEFRALRDFSRYQAASVVRTYLAFDSANVVTLVPRAGKKRGHPIDMRLAVHDMGQRRSVPDAALAHQPDATIPIPSPAIRSRVLPNGLKVVVLPLTSVPTLDIRLVFGAGTADEPSDKRGTAMLAGEALSSDVRHAEDAFNFIEAGGSLDVDVTRDSTSFIVTGVDMHLDYLLAGLRRWAVDGRYTGVDALVDAAQRQRKQAENDALADAWSAALYGARHPYGLPGSHKVARGLTIEDLQRFRSAYFTPDNATLVIAGHVDLALADKWVDFVFGDWTGHAKHRQTPARESTPASLIKTEELAQVEARVAMSAHGTRAQLLVAAAMLDEIASDARHQLGAAYSLNAVLDENRLATDLVIAGWFDPTRANEVMQLLRERIAQLRMDPTAAARAFVTARRRVITSLASLTGSASLLASRAEHDIGLGRAPLSDLQTAKEVQSLTIDAMTPVLAELDLSRATVLMRGPGDSLSGAFAKLERQPTPVRFDQAAQDALENPPSSTNDDAAKAPEERIQFTDIEDAITDQTFATQSRVEVVAAATITTAEVNNLLAPGTTMQVIEGGPFGGGLHLEAGWRIRKRFSAGLYLAGGSLGGSYMEKAVGVDFMEHPYSVLAVEGGAYAHIRARDRIWAGLTLGANANGLRFDGERSWTVGTSIGAEVGVDIKSFFNRHSLAGFLRVNTSIGAAYGWGALSLGVAYHL